jgi:threonine efflux protein
VLEVLPLLGVWLLAVITPGPDFVVIVQYSTSRSRRHGATVAAGVSSAILLWATGSMLGLSVLLARLSWLYEIVRLAGAGYLIARFYRRVRRWIDRVMAAVLIVLGGRLALDR